MKQGIFIVMFLGALVCFSSCNIEEFQISDLNAFISEQTDPPTSPHCILDEGENNPCAGVYDKLFQLTIKKYNEGCGYDIIDDYKEKTQPLLNEIKAQHREILPWIISFTNYNHNTEISLEELASEYSFLNAPKLQNFKAIGLQEIFIEVRAALNLHKRAKMYLKKYPELANRRIDPRSPITLKQVATGNIPENKLPDELLGLGIGALFEEIDDSDLELRFFTSLNRSNK
ncbi:hypothetical protein ACFLRA_01230 [Bdellovibrionota bacterium]